MEHTIYIVGIGPGNPEYVVPKGLQLIQKASVLVGSERSLQDFARTEQCTYPVTAKLKELVTFIREKLAIDDVVVMVSGDPGYYSLLPYLKKQFGIEHIEVIPGISSMTYAFARLGEPWQEADLMSFHGRQPTPEKLTYQEGRKLGFLTDKEYNPAHIATLLVKTYGWPSTTKAAACERLSYADEKIHRGTLADIQKLEGFFHSVMVVLG